MDYTREDVDRILEASKKATPGKWRTWSSGGIVSKGREYIVCFINDNGEEKYNQDLIAGAPILAEEVKRLRAENEKLMGEIIAWPIDYPPDDMV